MSFHKWKKTKQKTLPQSSSIDNDVHCIVIHQIIPDTSRFKAAVRSGLIDLTDNESELRLDWTTLFGSDSDCHLPDPAGEEIRADRLTDRSSHLQKMIYSKLSVCESPPKTMMYCIAITHFFKHSCSHRSYCDSRNLIIAAVFLPMVPFFLFFFFSVDVGVFVCQTPSMVSPLGPHPMGP